MSLVGQRVNPYHSRNYGRPSRGTRSMTGYEVDRSPLLLAPHFGGASTNIDENCVKVNMPPEEWNDNTTVITSDSFCEKPERFNPIQSPTRPTKSGCAFHLTAVLKTMFAFIIVFSAASMVIIPMVLSYVDDGYQLTECGVDCEANLFYIVVLTIALAVAVRLSWRSSSADMPRLSSSRTAFAMAVFFILVSFWLFYVVRTFLHPTVDFRSILLFSTTLLFLLITVHILWNSYQNRKPDVHFRVGVIRDPDGEENELIVGQTTIQEAAIQILKFYHTNFPAFNAYSEQYRANVGHRSYAQQSGFKIYDFENNAERGGLTEMNVRKLVEAAARQSLNLHSELCREEEEREKKILKKKYRLIAAAEEAFSQVKSLNDNKISRNAPPMNPVAAAQTVYGAVHKPLRRYLRVTRQHLIYTEETVMEDLQYCFMFGLTARVFLAKIFNKTPPVQNTVGTSKWSVVCEHRASANLEHGLRFILRCYSDSDCGIQLVCTVTQFSHYNLTEGAPPPRNIP